MLGRVHFLDSIILVIPVVDPVAWRLICVDVIMLVAAQLHAYGWLTYNLVMN